MLLKDSNLLRSTGGEVIPPPKISFGTNLAVNENYVVRKIGAFLQRSDDYGETYPVQIDTSIIGDLRMIHVFRNGALLVCGRMKAYYSNDWLTLQESTVIGVDGNPWIAPLSSDCFMALSGIEYMEVAGQEFCVWGNYNNDQNGNGNLNTIAECFYTRDRGATIKVFFKSTVTNVAGHTGVIRCRHIHQVVQNPYDGSFWILTGDEPRPEMSHVVKAVYNPANDTWALSKIGSGDFFKWGAVIFYDNHVYYSRDLDAGGMWKVPLADVSDSSKHIELVEIGTDMVPIMMGPRGDILVIPMKWFNANYDTRRIWYTPNQIDWFIITADMPEGYDDDSIFLRCFQPNSRGMVLSGIQRDNFQPMDEYDFMPSVWLNDILAKNGFTNAFK